MATIWINPGYDTRGFSRRELKEIVISVAVLALAFTLIYARSNTSLFNSNIVLNTVCWFMVSIIIVSVCFLLHEFGHKFTAQRYGAWAEYRMYPQGLVISLVTSLIGILVAMPGAVYISGYIDAKKNGIISIAGPGVNLILGALFMVLTFVTTGYVNIIVYLLAHFNIFLALFNMLPIPPLDGSKILAWNKPVYFVTLAACIALIVPFYI